MDFARKISSDDELRAIATAGAGFVIDPFYRRWHLAACPHIGQMSTRQTKWFAGSPGARDEYFRQRLERYPAAKPIRACATCCTGAGLTPSPDAVSRPGGRVAGIPGDDAAQVGAALREIVSAYGPAALSSPAQLASLLTDLLPDEPGVARMLVAAAEERVPDQLREHASTGLDIATAARLVASTFASSTHYGPDTCTWLIGEIATALGLITGTRYTPTVPATFPSPQAHPAGHRAGPTSLPEDLDGDPTIAMLHTLQASGHAASLQAIYDGLRELGYIPHIPVSRQADGEQTRYLRWTDPARGGPAVIYVHAGSLYFVRTEDLTALADLPAGTTTLGGRQHNVHLPIGPQTTNQILLAAQRIKY